MEKNTNNTTNNEIQEQITEYELDEANAILAEGKQNLLNLQ